MQVLLYLLVVLVIVGVIYYGFAKAVILVILGAVAIFGGSMFFFALYDAIRTRNKPKNVNLHVDPAADPDSFRVTPNSVVAVPEDDELARLRRMAGLEDEQ
jgi:hypothetical protein